MLVEPETVRLEHYWHDENKIFRHKYIELPLEIVRKARVIERYTFAYRLEIDEKNTAIVVTGTSLRESVNTLSTTSSKI